MKIKLSQNRQAGFIGIVLGILVLAVGGFVIYKLYQVAKHIKPAPTNDNDASTYYTYGGDRPSNIKNSYSQPAYLNRQLSKPLLPSFTFQYRIMADSNNVLDADLVVGTNLMDGQVTELINNDAEYKISFIVGGQTYVEDCDAVTGDTISEEISPAYTGNPCTVIVQRMTTYVWESIVTNYPCAVGSVNTFTDIDPPSNHAVYRLELLTTP